MFNIGAAELVIILLIAFLVVGPNDLPKVARWLGRAVKKLRKMIQEIKAETGWNEVEKEIREGTKEVKQSVQELDIRKDLRGARDEVVGSVKTVENELRDTGKSVKAELKDSTDAAKAAVDSVKATKEQATKKS